MANADLHDRPQADTAPAATRAIGLIWRRELRAGRTGLLIWTLALCALSFLYMWVFRSLIAPQADSIKGVLQALPEQMLAAFNFTQMAFSDPTSFFGSEPYTLVSLFGAICFALLGAGLLVKEESDGTAEFLLAKPVSRGGVVIGKAAAAATYALIQGAALSASISVAFYVFADGDYKASVLVQLGLGIFLVDLAYLGIALLISSSLRSARSATSAALGAVLAGYFIKVIAAVSNRLDVLGYVSPFRYADPGHIISHGGQTAIDILVLLAIFVAGVVLAREVYGRKDIQV